MTKLTQLIFVTVCILFTFAQNDTAKEKEKPFTWNHVGYGVSLTRMKDFNDTGLYRQCIIVGFGTHGAELAQVQTWLENLYIKRLKDFGIASLFAVQGPLNPDYDQKEQANQELMATLVKLYSVSKKPYIIFLAHGEGAYIANALLEKMRVAEYLNVQLYKKIIYFMLDGTADGYHPDFESKLLKTFGVYAFSDADEQRKNSRYYGSLQVIEYKYPNGFEMIPIDATKSGCETNYCLQNALINKRPARPDFNDIDLDYTKFGRDRRVTHEYLDVLLRENREYNPEL